MGRNGSGVLVRGSRIQIEFQLSGQRCRESLKLDPTKANIKYAERLKAEIEGRIAKGTFIYAEYFPDSSRAGPKPMKVEEAFGSWLAGHGRDLAHSTKRTYRQAIARINQSLGDKQISKVTSSDIREMAASWLDLSPASINTRLIPLRAMMLELFYDGAITVNPMDRVKNYRASSREPEPFNAGEQAALLDACPTPAVRNMVQFGLWTGLRIGELIELRWGDVDWVGSSIYISRSKVLGRVKDTKTVNGRRRVRLLPPALAALKAQKAITFLADGTVFVNEEGTPYTDKIVWKAWNRLIRRSGVRYREPRQMRHTYASMMLSAGESVAWVARQLGHSTPATTLRFYARWINDADAAGGNKAVEMFTDSDGVVGAPPSRKPVA